MEDTDTDYASTGKPQNRPPIVETQISKSKDGKWIIHKTVITDIKATGYYKEVLRDD